MFEKANESVTYRSLKNLLSALITTDNNCLQVDWLDEEEVWVFYPAMILSVDIYRLIIKYEYLHAKVDLRARSENRHGRPVKGTEAQAGTGGTEANSKYDFF